MGVKMDVAVTGLLIIGAVVVGLAVVLEGIWPLDEGE